MITQDVSVLEGVRDLLEEGSLGFEPEDLLRDGFCVVRGADVALFEKEFPGVYSGHYFFRSRGKEALAIAREMLSEAFTKAEVIQGLTPVDNKKAMWFTRRLGFKVIDVLDTPVGEMSLSMLTKKDFLNE